MSETIEERLEHLPSFDEAALAADIPFNKQVYYHLIRLFSSQEYAAVVHRTQGIGTEYSPEKLALDALTGVDCKTPYGERTAHELPGGGVIAMSGGMELADGDADDERHGGSGKGGDGGDAGEPTDEPTKPPGGKGEKDPCVCKWRKRVYHFPLKNEPMNEFERNGVNHRRGWETHGARLKRAIWSSNGCFGSDTLNDSGQGRTTVDIWVDCTPANCCNPQGTVEVLTYAQLFAGADTKTGWCQGDACACPNPRWPVDWQQGCRGQFRQLPFDRLRNRRCW